jgi:1-hydroxycarotenoid 3,4-desaturase
VKPFSTLWHALNGRFDDPRLVQLFGRYSTYTGASPFMAPATLMLIAHVELDGVWLVKGGMRELAQVMRRACEAKGVVIQTGAKVARIETDKGAARAVILENGERHSGDVVVVNADASAIGSGLFGADVQRAVDPVKPAKRSLSAIGWTLKAKTDGFPLVHHSVFFGQIILRSSTPSSSAVLTPATQPSISARRPRRHGGLADPGSRQSVC